MRSAARDSRGCVTCSLHAFALSPSKGSYFRIASIASARTERGSVQTSPQCAVSWKLTAQFPKHDTLLQTIILYGRYIIDGARLRVRANSMAAAAVTPAVASNAARFDVKNHCQLNGLA